MRQDHNILFRSLYTTAINLSYTSKIWVMVNTMRHYLSKNLQETFD